MWVPHGHGLVPARDLRLKGGFPDVGRASAWGAGATHCVGLCYNRCCRHEANGQWYFYNDAYVEQLMDDRLVTPDAYILFYRRIAAKPRPSEREIW